MLPLAAEAAPAFLPEVVALFVAGALIAYVSSRFGLVPIVGFLLAGVVIGPHGLGLVRDQALVDAAAEVGVILLLFTIGIEFSLEKLARIKRLIFLGGGIQVTLAVAATALLVAPLGCDWRQSVYTGFLVALSSTAIVLKLLATRDEVSSTRGQVALGLLIFQDLAVIAMVLVIPILSGGGGSAVDVLTALGKAALLIGAVLLVARRVMPRVLEGVAETCSPELFLLSVVAVCFGTAYLTSLAGVSLSLGAFLAGLVVSESRFSEHALSEILPLQILFSATFFVSVGMLLDVGFLLMNLPIALAIVAAVIVAKVVTTAASVKALGYPLSVAAASGLTLAQVGEFSFVLERAGRDAGLFPAGIEDAGTQSFIATSVLLMLATPYLTALGARLATGLEGRAEKAQAARRELDGALRHLPPLENHVIVAGYGDAARRLVRVLKGSRVPFVITTLSPAGANEAEAEGLPVLRGDASRMRTLEIAGVERAKVVVIADDDPTMAHRITSIARTLNPTMRIVVRTRYLAEVARLEAAGADRVVTEDLESIVALFSEVLRNYRISADVIERHEEAIRAGHYAALEPEGEDVASALDCRFGAECFDTRAVTVRAGSRAAGMTLGELGLESLGIRPLSLSRRGSTLREPADGWRLEPGDVITLEGSARAFADAASLFAGTGSNTVRERLPQEAAWIDLEKTVEWKPDAGAACGHVGAIRPVRPSARGCEECLRTGDRWVHLRICMSCGHVGCCDSSLNRHATKHHESTSHPIIRSIDLGESWGWCYPDRAML